MVSVGGYVKFYVEIDHTRKFEERFPVKFFYVANYKHRYGARC